MSNFLEDGTVLPSGLLTYSEALNMAGFNKTYMNHALRIGVITQTYLVSDERNRTKFTTEYDVVCIEQYEDKGATTITYKNCIATTGLGSIADFFEKILRQKEKKDYKPDTIRLSQQDGSIVLILCLDGSSDKAIIIGGFPHPDKPTTLTSTDPQLQGEYYGVNVAIGTDGSATFTWKGPTNNDGTLIDSSKGPTKAKIEADGSFQLDHKTVTFRMDISGVVTLTSTGDLNVSCAKANVNAKGDAIVNSGGDITATASGTATVEAPTVKLGAGASDAVIKGDTFKKYFDTHLHPTPIGPTGPPITPMPPPTLSKKVKTE